MFNKKTILGVGSLVVSGLTAANLYAADPGAYVGGQLGWGKTNQSSLTHPDFNNSFSVKDTGLAGRVFAGYQFDPTWAVEMGWTKFSTTDVKGTSTNLVSYHSLFPISPIPPFSWKENWTTHETVRTDALDLVGKATVPINDKVSVYGKAGAALVVDRFNETTTIDNSSYTFKGNSHETKLFPTFGVGASYAVTSNISADAGYDRIQKIGNTNMGSTNLVSLGMTYHFE